MKLFFKVANKTLIVSIAGEIDHHTSETIRERIDNQIDNNPIKNIIFDFNGVNFMDSAGIGVIIGRYKKVSELGGKLAVANVSMQVKKIMEISGILRIVKLYDSIDKALLNM
ncbi:MAG: anti-sigma F factor antagonist [Clostridiales bacterium]|nr:anti-sigma F factor antagonist [Clostridiales bacterium]HBM81082.1 anti-sigma F factor antagonist [Clostridiaceae bacterium]